MNAPCASRPAAPLCHAPSDARVRRRERGADGEQVECGGEQIQRGIGQRRQHRHRIGQQIGDGFQHHQSDGNTERGKRRAAHQGAVRTFSPRRGNERSRSRKQPLRTPRRCRRVAAIDQPVVQAERPVAPEFDLEAASGESRPSKAAAAPCRARISRRTSPSPFRRRSGLPSARDWALAQAPIWLSFARLAK